MGYKIQNTLLVEFQKKKKKTWPFDVNGRKNSPPYSY